MSQPVSQPANGITRSSRSVRSTMKRTLSVDDVTSVALEACFADKAKEPFVVVNSKRRRKQKLQKSDLRQASTQSHSGDVNSGFVAGRSTNDGNDDSIDAINSKKLINEINELKGVIKTLQGKLSFVLSFLGITDDALPVSAEPPAQKSDVTVAESLSVVEEDITNGASESVPQSQLYRHNCVNNNQASQLSASYANAVRQPATLSIPLKQAVVSAVYADFEEKDRRSRNVVISGLPVSTTPDKTAAENLCQSEFGFTPQILKCHRLGQPIPGRVQPLLVKLQSSSEAENLIRNARFLRQSPDPVIKSSVYINPDLTRAEALTAYQRRCRRRQLAAARSFINSTSTIQQQQLTNNQSAFVSDSGATASQAISVLNTRVQSVDPPTSNTLLPPVNVLPLEPPTDTHVEQRDMEINSREFTSSDVMDA